MIPRPLLQAITDGFSGSGLSFFHFWLLFLANDDGPDDDDVMMIIVHQTHSLEEEIRQHSKSRRREGRESEGEGERR